MIKGDHLDGVASVIRGRLQDQALRQMFVSAHLGAGWANIIRVHHSHVLGAVSISEPAGMSLYGRHARAVSDRDRWPLFWK